MEFVYEPREDYLLVGVQGELDLEAAVEQFGQVLTQCHRHGIHKVLVDYREMTGTVLMSQRYLYFASIGKQFGSYLRNMEQPLRLAYVPPPAMLPSDGYGERAAADHGLNIMATIDMDEAIAWLSASGIEKESS